MNAIIAWFAENKVAANLVMVFVVVAGIISLQDTRKEILPNISLDLITISVPYPGASPEDVEKSVLNRIESAIYDLEGIKSLSSKATEHLGVLTSHVCHGGQNAGVVELRAQGRACAANKHARRPMTITGEAIAHKVRGG